MGQPSIIISFQDAARMVVKRGQRGIIGMIVKDNVPRKNPCVITGASDIPSTLTAANQQLINEARTGYLQPATKIILYVVGPTTVGSTTTVDYTDALDYFATIKLNWLIAPSAETDGKVSELVTWVKNMREKDIQIKAILPNASNPNCEGIVNFTTASAAGGGTTYTTETLCARVGGILATTPLTGGQARSATYAPIPELESCETLTQTEMDEACDNGELIIFWDGEKCKLGRAVNSLKTTEKSDQWKKIRVVEIMDIIKDDIQKTAQDNFIGKYVASYDNKMLLIAAIKLYLATLAKDNAIEEITDGDVDLDIDKIKDYLANQGIDYTQMTDDEIRHANTGSHVYIKVYISILDAIEDIEINITI